MKDLPPDTTEIVDVHVLPDGTTVSVVKRTTVHETFAFTALDGREITYDVTVAKAAVAAGEIVACPPIAPPALAEIVANNTIAPDGVEAADPREPGIGAAMRWQGEVIYILIDGSHRAARALRDGVPFSAHLLTDDATRRCYLSGDRGLLP